VTHEQNRKHRAGKPGEPADWKVYPTYLVG
jgi:hypothetical protein